MAEQAKKVGGRIAELRQERKWSKAELARQLSGVATGNDVRRWEQGEHLPRPNTLDAIAKALGTGIADLYAGPMAGRKQTTPDVLGESPTPQLDRIEEQLADLQQQMADMEARDKAAAARVAEQERLQEKKRPPAKRRKATGS